MAAYISFQPRDFFNTVLYAGNTSTNAITGVGFQPDMCWFKDRDSVYNHVLQDAVRGSTKTVYPDDGNGQDTYANGQTSFDADGFTLGNQATTFNKSGDDYVSWNWKAGTTTGIGSGDITPTGYSFSTTAGISIVNYTGTGVANTLPHGLGAVPKFWAIKNLSQTSDWRVYHVGTSPTVPWEKDMVLNTNVAVNDSTSKWNDTAPTSTVLTLGTDAGCNNSGNSLIAYVFADKPGFSRFGTWKGNGTTDGAFVYTGFRPAFILTKSLASGNWTIWDTKREGYNSTNDEIYANTSAAEGFGNVYVDLVSNGFKWLVTDGMVNGDGGDYIYAAFAEFPTVSSNDLPGLAR